MNSTESRTTVRVDGYTRFCLTVLAVLLTLLIIGLWANDGVFPAGSSALAAPARDGVKVLTDAKVQRAAMISALEQTNRRLERILGILESGKLQVVVVERKGKKAAQNVPAKSKQ